jgi:hypothetical protein
MGCGLFVERVGDLFEIRKQTFRCRRNLGHGCVEHRLIRLRWFAEAADFPYKLQRGRRYLRGGNWFPRTP